MIKLGDNYQCPYCEMRFRLMSTLQQHRDSKHRKEITLDKKIEAAKAKQLQEARRI